MNNSKIVSLSGEKMSTPLSAETFCPDLKLCQRCKQTASYSAITTSQLIFQHCENTHHHLRRPTDLPFVLVENDPNLGERGLSFPLALRRERDSAIAFKVRITPTPQKSGGENPRYGHRIITIYWPCLGRQGYCV